MSAEKRSVSTDALATLGTIIADGGRDAIHLAVEPVIAGETLYPGQDIGLKDGKAYGLPAPVKALGIVDPFIKGKVVEGAMFWLIVYPRQITSLRHVWAHPDFDVEEKKPNIESNFHAEQWLRNYAQAVGLTYQDLINAAEGWISGREYICDGGTWEGEYVPDELWDNYEIIKDTKVESDKRGSFFSCSC